MGDNCPICTEGLRALVALLDAHQGTSGVRELKAEQALVGERLEAAFGKPVEIGDVDFLRMRVDPLPALPQTQRTRLWEGSQSLSSDGGGVSWLGIESSLAGKAA